MTSSSREASDVAHHDSCASQRRPLPVVSGWYIMHRGWMESFKPEPFTEREAFLWSIERAAFQGHDQWFNGHRVRVERGEFATSIRQMAEAFQWSVKKTRCFMERMRKCQKWAQRAAHEGAQAPTVIMVCNYDIYQSVDDDQGTAKGTVKGKRGAQQGHSKGTQQKQGKQGNKGKEEDSPSDSSISDADPPALAGSPPALLPTVSAQPDDAEIAFERLDTLRREFVPNARAVELTPQRKRALVARLREIGGLGGWDEVLSIIRASPFLRGDTSRDGFVAKIDWILTPANLRKVREGNYDHDGKSNLSGSQLSGGRVPRSPIAGILAAHGGRDAG